ncbi:uncharacterized protein LOC144168628 [Haemaphysalis longicornis]
MAAKSRGIFLETDRSYKYDLPTSLPPSKESNCSGKCVHVFMGLLCDFVDEQANCGEQFLRCCVGGIFSPSAGRKSGHGMMDDSPSDHRERDSHPSSSDVTTTTSTTTTESPAADTQQPVADTPPSPQEPEPTLPSTTTEKSGLPSYAEEGTNFTTSESQQSPQIESPPHQNFETVSEKTPCPGSCVMPLLGLLCGSVNRNYSCPSGRVCCTVSQSAEASNEEGARSTTTSRPTKETATAQSFPVPANPVRCIGRCIPMYLSNTCKRPNVILISRKLFCSSGMVCCSKGMAGETTEREPTKNESYTLPFPAELTGDNPTSVSPEASSQDEEYSWENHRLRRPPYIHPVHRIPVPSQQTQSYGRPPTSVEGPISEPTLLQPPHAEDMNYGAYAITNDYEKGEDVSQVTRSTRRPPTYAALRHPSLPPPVIPTPPYYDEDYDSKLPNEFHQAKDKHQGHNYPEKQMDLVRNHTAPHSHSNSETDRLNQRTMLQPAPQRGPIAVGEVFPVKNPHGHGNIEQRRKAWLQRVQEKTRPARPERPRPGESTKPELYNTRKSPQRFPEFGTTWVEPVKASPEVLSLNHYVEAASTSTGWIPFHQAHQPVNKQKVVENHYGGGSSEFKPIRGPLVDLKPTSRDHSSCGVKGGKKRDMDTFRRGGAEARPGEWCWHAAIVDRKNQYLCNGALIGAQWVLTAASCVFNHTDVTENIYVRLGYTDIVSQYNPPGAQTKTVAKVYAHHSFQASTLANNIALLKLKDIVALNDAACVICLPTASANASDDEPPLQANGEGCVVTGYGASVSEDDLRYTYPTLREAPVTALEEDSLCRSWQSRARQLKLDLEVKGSTFCVGDGDVQEDCIGDPARLVVCPSKDYYFEITGISSDGLACGGPDALAVYTNVSSYSGWINQITNINRF